MYEKISAKNRTISSDFYILFAQKSEFLRIFPDFSQKFTATCAFNRKIGNMGNIANHSPTRKNSTKNRVLLSIQNSKFKITLTPHPQKTICPLWPYRTPYHENRTPLRPIWYYRYTTRAIMKSIVTSTAGAMLVNLFSTKRIRRLKVVWNCSSENSFIHYYVFFGSTPIEAR